MGTRVFARLPLLSLLACVGCGNGGKDAGASHALPPEILSAPPVPRWRGPPPTPDELVRARISRVYGGGHSPVVTSALVAEPNAKGGYRVRVEHHERRGGLVAEKGGQRIIERHSYRLSTYMVGPEGQDVLREALQGVDLTQLEEYEQTQAVDVGESVHFFDLPDGRRVVFGGAGHSQNPQRKKAERALEEVFTVPSRGAPAWSRHVVEYASCRELETTEGPDQCSELSLIRPRALEPAEVPQTPGAVCLISLRSSAQISAETAGAFFSGRSTLLAAQALVGMLRQHDELSPDRLRHYVGCGLKWVEEAPYLLRLLQWPLKEALARVAAQPDDAGLNLLLAALQSKAEQGDHRNIFRQCVPCMLRNCHRARPSEVESALIGALRHQDVYVRHYAAQVLAQLNVRDGGLAIMAQAEREPTCWELWCCALALGRREAALPFEVGVRGRHPRDPKPRLESNLGAASCILGVPITQADLDERLRSIPLEDPGKLPELALARLRQAQSEKDGAMMHRSIQAIIGRRYEGEKVRKALLDCLPVCVTFHERDLPMDLASALILQYDPECWRALARLPPHPLARALCRYVNPARVPIELLRAEDERRPFPPVDTERLAAELEKDGPESFRYYGAWPP